MQQAIPVLQGIDAFRQLIRCPITGSALHDPVVASDGHTYEKFALQTWLRTHGHVSPVSLQNMPSSTSFPNHTLRSLLGFVPKDERRVMKASEILETHTTEIIFSQPVVDGELLVYCSQVCALWSEVASQESLWVRVLEQEFDVSASCAAREGRSTFRKCYAKAAGERQKSLKSAWSGKGLLEGKVRLHRA